MRAAPFSARISIPAGAARRLLSPADGVTETDEWFERVADILDRNGFVLLKIGALRLDGTESTRIADAIISRLRAELVRRGAPSALVSEFDPVDDTMVEEGFITRDRIPHNDGQRTTFLTPSTVDVHTFSWRDRRFGESSGSSNSGRSGRHKVFSAIQVMDPGEALSITTFFDCFAMVARSYRVAFGTGADMSPLAVQRWLAGNIWSAQERQPEHGSPYISLVGLLGGQIDSACEAVSFSTLEREIEPELLDKYPQLDVLRQKCPCGRCQRDTERIYCQMLSASLGLTWPEAREEYEVWMSSERYDLLFWNNIAQLHGAVMGSRTRLLRPIYLSLSGDEDDEYERWLSALWHDRLGRVATGQ